MTNLKESEIPHLFAVQCCATTTGDSPLKKVYDVFQLLSSGREAGMSTLYTNNFLYRIGISV